MQRGNPAVTDISEVGHVPQILETPNYTEAPERPTNKLIQQVGDGIKSVADIKSLGSLAKVSSSANRGTAFDVDAYAGTSTAGTAKHQIVSDVKVQYKA